MSELDGMDWLGDVLRRFNELVEPPGEIGDHAAFVLNDAVVVIGLDLNEDGERTVKINAILGEPERMDITTGWLEKASDRG